MKRIAQALFLSLFMFSCGSDVSTEDFNSDYSLYEGYISNFTSGLVSTQSDIRVVFAFAKDDWAAEKELDSDLLQISPKIKGKLVALSSNAMAFIPDEKLEQDTEYRVTLNLGDITDVPKELRTFNFSFKTLKQDFIVNTLDLQSYSKDWQYLNGTIQTSDDLDFETAVKLIEANQGGKKLSIKFDKHMSSQREFHFMIDSIQRKVDDSTIDIKWDGTPYEIEQEGELKFEIPGKSNFKIVHVEVEEKDEQVLLINFTDPIKTGQNLNGLVQVEEAGKLRFAIKGNILKVFFQDALDGELLVEVFRGIQSEDGYKMKADFSEKVSFSQLKPGIRFVRNGTILPGSSNLKINFQAVNLSDVDVKVYKIYANNVLQFLQENDLNGDRNLRKVAAPIATKKINLASSGLNSSKKWTNYAVDLSHLIKPDPGAIYRLELSFKKSYSLYACEGVSEPMDEDEDATRDKFDVRSVDDYDYYDYYWYDNYDYYEDENPCENSFYRRSPIGMNILASDLGVIAKRGENGEYLFVVNNILSTDPVSGATVELYTYQQQLITSIKTNGEGLAKAKATKYAYFAIVKKDKHTTYIKLDEGHSNSVSNFDVSGNKLKDGLKGYLYGERGVWRPGDTLFIGFMLNDIDNPLDANHPVKLKLRDPNGKDMYQSVQKYNKANHYKFVVPTSPEYMTGNWEAVVSVGGAHFYKSIKIETIKPNRLKINNKFQASILSSAKPNVGNLQVNWLHGAVAKNLKVEMYAKFIQQKTSFKNYAQYIFDDPVRTYETEETLIFSGKVDDEGKASYSIQPTVEDEAPGMLRAVIMTKAYENGGDFSTDVLTTNYSPYRTYVGLNTPEPNKYGMLETGKNNRFEVVTLDEKGAPKSTKNLQVNIYKVSWRWWWDASYDNLSHYTSSYSNSLVKSYQISTNSAGKASFDFKATDDEWGRYLIRVTDPVGGHATGTTVLIDWPYWSGKTKNTSGDHASMLVFSTDKTNYNSGEKAKVSFPSSAGGRALISLENGSGVVQTMWVKTEKGETKVEIPLTKAMAPNVFVHITLLQPHNSTMNDSPIRMYGIVPIEVVDKETILEPVINMPNVLQPEESASIKVSEKSGKAMTYTIAIVDEGLLDLTRFKTPNAWNEFYTREALGVRTWDIYNDIIGAFGGKINQIFSIGGDEDLSGAKAKKANRFKPVVIYLGPFTLDKGETKTHNIKMPYYVGSVRTMVVAGDVKTEAYGMAEKATPVRKPLMVLASMPRQISPTEKITLPVTVFAMEKHVKDVSIQVKTNNGIKVVGSSTQSISIKSPDEGMVYFELEAGNLEGIGKVQVMATSGSEKAYYEVELDIANPNPVTFEVHNSILEANSTGSINFETFGVQGSNEAWIEVSSLPAIDLSRRLEYLIRYPHGCLEQTTSAVFPQLFLDEVLDLDAKEKNKIQHNLTEGIKKLGRFQLSNGGFAYWPGQNHADDWASSYAGHFLLEAEKRGYVLPINFRSKWIAYQQKAAKDWRFSSSYGNDFAQAYRLYTLALAGNADLSSMNRLRSTPGISSNAKLRLAAAYAIVGQKSAALTLLNSSSIQDVSPKGYTYYGSAERNRAMMLETLVLMGDKQKAFKMAETVAKSLSSKNWMSTQATAYSLYSMAVFAKQNGSKGVTMNYSIAGKSGQLSTKKSIAREKLVIKKGQNAVQLKNTQGNTLFVRVVVNGILPIGEEKTFQQNLTAEVVYRDRVNSPIYISNVTQGSEFYADIEIKNTSLEFVENVALSHIIPSGFEIVNTRYTDFGGFGNNEADYIDIRDDRTNFYFSLKAGERKTFRVLLNASYIGRYYLPGMQAEAMYDNSYSVRTSGKWVEITK